MQVEVKETRPWRSMAVTAVLLVAAAAGTARLLSDRRAILNAKDTVVLADFTNSTGDATFDETLRRGLTIQLEQSPFLSLISDQRIARTLSLMGRPPGARLTPEITRAICERTGSAAVLDGSIAPFGSQYVLALQARNCSTGEALDQQQVQAAKKEDVLAALSQIASRFRKRVSQFSPYQCDQCGTANIVAAPVLYQQGTHSYSTRFHSGTTQSYSAQAVAPPLRLGYVRPFLLWGPLFFLLCLWTFVGVRSVLEVPRVTMFRVGLAAIFLVLDLASLAGLVSSLRKVARYNRDVYPRLQWDWEHTYVCRRCGKLSLIPS
jgi:hypothetical protein